VKILPAHHLPIHPSVQGFENFPVRQSFPALMGQHLLQVGSSDSDSDGLPAWKPSIFPDIKRPPSRTPSPPDKMVPRKLF